MAEIMSGSILILTEPMGGGVHPVAYELIGKAREIGGETAPVHCLALGAENMQLSELCRRGCDAVYHIQGDCFSVPQEELFAANVVAFIQEHEPSVVLVGATGFGRSLAPRVAAALEVGLTADCTQLRLDDTGRLIQIRPAFSGNILAHIRSDRQPQMATIRYKEFAPAGCENARPEKIVPLAPYKTNYDKSRVLRVAPRVGGDITEAQVVVAAGRGLRKKEDLALLEELAALLDGTVGVSRALVDAGMADSTIQVGYSGHRVKPRLYIACGISGAPQHMAGMKESDIIVAVNSDASAPIFSQCDYGIVGDLYEVLPRMIDDIKAMKGVQ